MFDQIKLKVGITPTNNKLKIRADIRKNFLALFDLINLIKGLNDFSGRKSPQRDGRYLIQNSISFLICLSYLAKNSFAFVLSLISFC